MPDPTEHISDVRTLRRFTFYVLRVVAFAFLAGVKRLRVEIAERRADFHTPFTFYFTVGHINALHVTFRLATDGHFDLFVVHRLIERQHFTVIHRHTTAQAIVAVECILHAVFRERCAGRDVTHPFVGHFGITAKPVHRIHA